MEWLILAQAAIFAAFVSLLVHKLLATKPLNKLPPGPHPLPIVGNIRDIPEWGKPLHLHWIEHKDRYGPISSVTVLGQTMVIIHDRRVASELMDKRSSIYSSRPHLEFASELCGFKYFLVNHPYNKTYRMYRKFGRIGLGTKSAVSGYNPLQNLEANRFIISTFHKPEDLVQHLKTEAGAVILSLTYGYSISPDNDPLVTLGNQVNLNSSHAIVPGFWMVDVFPMLKYVPTWLGAGFKKTAKQWKDANMKLATIPFSFVKEQMAQESHKNSYVSDLLRQLGSKTPDVNEENAIKFSAGSLYAGGADTTVSTLSWFFLAMVKYPDVQRRAQEELDKVISPSRLPGLEDRDNLPYIEAVYKETLRWEPIAVMGIPHATDRDDVYEGYLIPKGSTVWPAIWWFMHDPEVYHQPELFKPERFADPYHEPDPSGICFGYGRRRCPGRLLADSQTWLTIAKSLAVFNITKAIDEHGNEIEPRHEAVPDLVSYPLPFMYNITARGPEQEELIRQVEAETPPRSSDQSVLKDMGL